MIGVDTSVIVRYLVGIPVDQAARAATFVDRGDQLGVSIVAIIETAHVLRTQYAVSRADVAASLIDLLTRDDIETLELPKADVLEALVRARTYASVPIPDALIAAASRSAGALPVYTFDEDFGRLGIPVATPS